jgi:hypothetical protein
VSSGQTSVFNYGHGNRASRCLLLLGEPARLDLPQSKYFFDYRVDNAKGGELPFGLFLEQNSGAIFGTPSEAKGPWMVWIRAKPLIGRSGDIVRCPVWFEVMETPVIPQDR